MVKYNIEGNIDFYDELYKSLDIEENNHKTEEDLTLCLITKEQLTEKHFTMECGHKFNYIPLFNDIKNHKQKFNGFEVAKGQLKIDEIRCPYCRNKQKGVLPYYDDLFLEKVNGVNYISGVIKDKKSEHNMMLCQVLVPKYSSNKEENQELVKCNRIGHKIDFNSLKTQTYPFNQTQIEILDTNHYCYKHKMQKIKDYKKCIIYNMKQELKLQKIQEKEAQKKEKKEKQQKMFINTFGNMAIDSSGNNTVIKPVKNSTYLSGNYPDMDLSGNSFVNPITESNCVEILKTGKNKGNSCGCKIFADNLCKRHYNLKVT